MRASWDETFLRLARCIAESRSSCLRRKAGAVLVKNRRVLSLGYNGAPEGEPHCVDLGFCSRNDSKPGEDLDRCRTAGLHAEMNAIINAARQGVSTEGATIYCTHSPCRLCSAAIRNAGIAEVVYEELYEGFPGGPEFLRQMGVKVRRHDIRR